MSGESSSSSSDEGSTRQRKGKALPLWPLTDDDRLLAAYPHTKFKEDTKEYKKFQRIRSCKVARGGVIDWAVLEEFGLKDRALSFIGGLNTPWSWLYGQELDAHREMTVEFLSTFRYNPNASEMPSTPDDTRQVEFRLFGQPHKMSLKRFVVRCGLYTEEETETEGFNNALKQAPEDVLSDFWAIIAPEKPPFGHHRRGKQERATSIKDPLYRYFHRLNTKTINGRSQGGEWISVTDLFLLYCLLKHIPCNLPHVLAHYLHGFYRRKTCWTIVCGHIITAVAHSLELHPKVNALQIRSVKPYKHGKQTLYGMQVLQLFGRIPRLVWDKGTKLWTGPDPLELPQPLPGVRIEEVHEGRRSVDVEVEELDDDDTPFRPPRSYQVVRLPTETSYQLDHISSRVTSLEQVVSIIQRRQKLDHGRIRWICDMLAQGKQSDYPPSPPPDIGTSTAAAAAHSCPPYTPAAHNPRSTADASPSQTATAMTSPPPGYI